MTKCTGLELAAQIWSKVIWLHAIQHLQTAWTPLHDYLRTRKSPGKNKEKSLKSGVFQKAFCQQENVKYQQWKRGKPQEMFTNLNREARGAQRSLVRDRK